MVDLSIRPLQCSEVHSFRELRLEALALHPESFSASFDEWSQKRDEELSNLLSADASGIVFGAFVDGAGLVGIAGFQWHSRRKYQHKGSVWGMYVRPEWQGRGIARALLERVIARAREKVELTQILLTVTRGNQAAHALYETLGFRQYGIEPRALKVGSGDYRDEVLMVLDLLA
ncbi:GNAT family N-acetyltransferase [Acidisoma sp. S159]|uniref:GNAT family N-acetyltransferase n=1 Tax=Acidisoma sp. S159 TaxID=1747225 RepID=UPI00131AF608|nr:N-acetyltransferase [Acidisoma sp. S159]